MNRRELIEALNEHPAPVCVGIDGVKYPIKTVGVDSEKRIVIGAVNANDGTPHTSASLLRMNIGVKSSEQGVGKDAAVVMEITRLTADSRNLPVTTRHGLEQCLNCDDLYFVLYPTEGELNKE